MKEKFVTVTYLSLQGTELTAQWTQKKMLLLPMLCRWESAEALTIYMYMTIMAEGSAMCLATIAQFPNSVDVVILSVKTHYVTRKTQAFSYKLI